MMDGFLHYCGLRYARFQFRKDLDQAQNFNEFLRNARRVLVLLPLEYNAAVCAANAVRVMREQYPLMQMTVVNTSASAAALSDLMRCEVLRMSPTDINKLSLPRKTLLERVLAREYDVALDLNLDFVLHTAYICKASHAKVRVGLTHRVSDAFFNVQLKLERQGSPQAMYEKFSACLAMF